MRVNSPKQGGDDKKPEKKDKNDKDKDKGKKKKKKKEPKPVRKIFVSFKVKRVSDIDNVKEEFRIKFHLYFNWLPTYKGAPNTSPILYPILY